MVEAGDGWIDVTIPVRTGMVHWPGTPGVRIEPLSDVEKGDPYTIRRMELDSHTGTHVDAPSHFIPGGNTIDDMPLEATVGTARVIEIDDPLLVKPGELALFDISPGERVLLKTLNSWRCRNGDEFVEDYVCVSYEAALYLVKRGVMTVGIDYLSVASFDQEVMIETHRALLSAGIYIIEGLDLRGVEPGDYEMICLPLRIEDGDGSPCRAFLRPRRESGDTA